MTSTTGLIHASASATFPAMSSALASSVASQVAADKAAQLRLSQTMPMFLWATIGALVVLTIFAIHVPFFVRLYSSLGTRASSQSSHISSSFEAAGLTEGGEGREAKRISGGELFTGWVLRAGRQASALVRRDTSSGSRLLPPPREQMIYAKLPLSQLRHHAPLAKLPDVLASPINVIGLLMVLAYVAATLTFMIYKSDLGDPTKTSGYGQDFARTGMLATAQIPLVFLLGTRNSPLGLLVGRSYEKLKVLHKIVGKLIFLATTLHVAFFLHKWVVAGIAMQYIGKPFVVAGLVAWLAQVVIVITALPWMRRFCFGVFEVSHMLGMISLLVGLSFHVDEAQPWCVAGGIIYGVSLLSSLLKTRVAEALFQADPDSGSTTIRIPAIRTGWRPGQHVRIRIPALQFPYNLEAHPFSIASSPEADGLKLVVKAIPTGWSSHLLKHAANGMGVQGSRTSRIVLEGPYGGFGNTLPESFSSVVLIAGGSGISHALGVASSLVTRASSGTVRARTIDLVWIIRNEPEGRQISMELAELVRRAKATEEMVIEGRRKGRDLPPPVAFRVEVYLSRTPIADALPSKLSEALNEEPEDPFGDANPFSDHSEAEKEKRAYLSRSNSTSSRVPAVMSKIDVRPRKPHFDLVLGSVVGETATRCLTEKRQANGCLVVACGPKSMVDSVRSAVVGLKWWEHEGVNGVDYHEEAFGF